MNYISISLYKKMLDHALTEGMRREDFLKLPTPIDAVEGLRAVPADHFFFLHEYLDENLGPGFSVRVGQEMKIDDYGVLGLSWKTCSRAGEIFERSERYFKLLSNTYLFKVGKNGDISRIYLYRDAWRRGVELSNEATFSATVVVLRAITETDILPVQVSFKHNPPRGMEGYESAFRCEILFDQRENFIAYKTADLETKTAKADESINRFLVERVEEQTKGVLSSADKIAGDVEALVRNALPSGIPSVAKISRHMGMSNRTLTRRLTEIGVTFRDIVQKSQRGIAEDLLRKTSRSIAEIAFETGFSDQSAFTRSFKRWTGESPLTFRKNRP